MIKFGLISCLVLSIILLGLTLPLNPPPPRDPVPPSQKVAHSNHCAGCHGYDPTKQAMVDESGNDVNIHDDWQISMMGLAAHDPFWRAEMSYEVNRYPSAREHIETTCLKCHSPLGSFQAHFNGESYSYEKMLQDSLGLDGVSCSACHQQPMQGLGKGHTGNITIDTNRIFFGQYPNPFKGSMQIYVGFEPEFSDHIYSSGVCAGCHTLISETLDDDGNPTGNFFTEQATYHEWLNSAYPAQGKECQTCHLPFIPDEVVIATELLALEPRAPFGLHQFFGANTAMLSLLRQHKDSLDLPKASSEAAWTESIENNRMSLQNAASVHLENVHVANDTLYAHVVIKNKTGHKLPSGYPNRLAWLQVVLLNHDDNQDTLYANGIMDAQGHIRGRDFPYEPHHEISRSDKDVQIYEMVMADLHGNLTTTLNAAAHPMKDNRLLPLGFTRSHSVYDTVAIWGEANADDDYDQSSNLGQDKIEYRIPLHEHMGFGDLQVSLQYQTLPARWMEELFAHDSLPLVSSFKSMYEDYRTFSEVMETEELTEIDLNAVAVQFPNDDPGFNIAPNPFSGLTLFVEIPDQWKTRSLDYKIISTNGEIIYQGKLAATIEMKNQLPRGAYYIQVSDVKQLIGIRRFVSL